MQHIICFLLYFYSRETKSESFLSVGDVIFVVTLFVSSVGCRGVEICDPPLDGVISQSSQSCVVARLIFAHNEVSVEPAGHTGVKSRIVDSLKVKI